MTLSMAAPRGGPLAGLKVLEFAALGPAPFCAMVLADMGAEVLRIERPGWRPYPGDVTMRGRPGQAIDVKDPEGLQAVLALTQTCDVLLEGHRPGVMESIGLGPDECMRRNPRLVYGRVTGWGQSGPLAATAGHDINYIAISGALHATGRAGGPPVVPLNYVGDYGGGAMLLLSGVLAALYEVQRSGKGQVVDAAMSDGAALLSSLMYGFKSVGQWNNARGSNMLDGGAPFYDVYRCADGKYIAVGAVEPKFYALFCERCGLTDPVFTAQMDRTRWPEQKQLISQVFGTRTRDEWCAVFEGSDGCVSPVLDWDEAPRHPQNVARKTFSTVDDVVQPSPAPRFSRTPCEALAPAQEAAQRTRQLLAGWGADDEALAYFRRLWEVDCS